MKAVMYQDGMYFIFRAEQGDILIGDQAKADETTLKVVADGRDDAAYLLALAFAHARQNPGRLYGPDCACAKCQDGMTQEFFAAAVQAACGYDPMELLRRGQAEHAAAVALRTPQG